MKVHPQSIFETSEDYISWEKYEQQNDLIEGLSDPERQQASVGIRYLRGLLGEDFLRRSAEVRNPIFRWYFRDSSPGARRSLIRFAEQLKALEGAPNFNGLVARLKKTERVEEGLTVLETGYKFLCAGFEIHFDPETTSGSVPDLRIVDCDNGEDIYVEVSRLRKGGHEELTSRTYHALHDTVHHAIWQDPEGTKDIADLRLVRPYVRILKGLGDRELVEVAQKINDLMNEVRTTREYREFTYKDSVEMAMSPAEDHSKAKAWALERDMRDFVEAPPIPLDGIINKARTKVLRKLGQLPGERPGIIVVPANESLLLFVFDPRQIIMEIAEELRPHRNLFCAVITHHFNAGEQEPFVAQMGEHVVISTTNPDFSTERSLLIMNDSFGLPLSDVVAKKVRRAFVPAGQPTATKSASPSR